MAYFSFLVILAIAGFYLFFALLLFWHLVLRAVIDRLHRVDETD